MVLLAIRDIGRLILVNGIGKPVVPLPGSGRYSKHCGSCPCVELLVRDSGCQGWSLVVPVVRYRTVFPDEQSKVSGSQSFIAW